MQQMAANAEQAHAKSLIANYVVIILLLTILWLLYEGVSDSNSFFHTNKIDLLILLLYLRHFKTNKKSRTHTHTDTLFTIFITLKKKDV